MYDKDYAYAGTRLNGTYVTLENGTPIYINEVTGKGTVDYLNLLTNAHDVCHLDLVNCKPVRLGYVNTPEGAVYVSRIPSRRYRQGLTLQSVNCRILGEPALRNNINNANLASCIKGNYLSIKEIGTRFERAVKKINPFDQGRIREIPSFAWSRRWALQRNGKVEYRGKVVGDFVNGKVQLLPKFKYLKEELEESL